MFQQKDTALIGLIVMGASASIEKAFHKNVPDRVQITTTRVPFGEVSYNGFLEVTRKLPDAASLLMDAQPDVIAITNLIGGCIRGSEIINTLQQITGVPVLMPAFELVRALRQIRAGRIAIVSIFSNEFSLLESMFFGTVKGSYTGAANTTGLFEQARNGTLFLDEINSMDISLQAKLLKVIENKTVRRIGDMKEREIRCRILCALNEAPLACIENGKLRRDLYYRLSSCILYIPPLRERKSDIPLLCSFFLKHFNKEYGRHIHRIDPELMDRFLEYPWPGNVRELQHVVESAFSVSRKDMEILQLGHLSHYYRDFFTASKPEAVSGSQAAPGPVSPRSPQSLKAYMDSCEKNFLAAALCSHNNNITATARSLQITRQALQHKIRKYGL